MATLQKPEGSAQTRANQDVKSRLVNSYYTAQARTIDNVQIYRVSFGGEKT